MISNTELNQEKLNQITTLSSLLECSFKGEVSESEDKQSLIMDGFYIYQKGWHQDDADLIRKKIIKLMDELK